MLAITLLFKGEYALKNLDYENRNTLTEQAAVAQNTLTEI